MKVETLSLSTEGRSLISWKDLFFTCRQVKGKSLMKTLRLHITVNEPSQYITNKYLESILLLLNSDYGAVKKTWKLNRFLAKVSASRNIKFMSTPYSRM